ncbi:MAG TPA: RNA methyltransferase [Jatrophihabitans sp.]|nr:RNA methyltransferase [Jatrophihabitans sp.]
MLSDSNARLAAARRLTRRQGRREAGLFLAEGAPSVLEALRRPEHVVEVFATAAALERYGHQLVEVRVDEISEAAAAKLSETVTPQGLVAVCRRLDISPAEALAGHPRLVVVLVEPNDPGNVGTILRTADAAGADAVVVAGGVDVYNGKTVRAAAGSLFHLDVVTDVAAHDVVAAGHAAGLSVLATSGAGAHDLDDLIDHGTLARPTMWLFGTEAHGLSDALLDAADTGVRVPIHGRAESLNLAAAAAVCLYASARAQRQSEA